MPRIKNPEFARACMKRAETSRSLGNHEQALADYVKAVEFDPEFLEARVRLADLSRQLGRYEEALASYTRAIELSPRQRGALQLQGERIREPRGP